MTTTTNTESIEALRTFAEQHGELQFAHLCTAALAGEAWAVERVERVLASNAPSECQYLGVIRTTDTTRPDGAIARSITL